MIKAVPLSLKEANAGGGSWDCISRPREMVEAQMSFFPQREKYPTESKQRWAKELRHE
jgi:hypothetical protein